MILSGLRTAVFAVTVGTTALLTAGAPVLAATQAGASESSPSILAERAFIRSAPRPAWVELLPLAPVAQPQGPVSIALSDLQLRLDDGADGGRAVYLRRAAHVHNAAALDSVGRIDLDFLPAFQQLHLHGVAIVRDGQRFDRLAGAQVRFLQREAALDHGIYTGAVSVNIVVDDLRVGDILDIDYTVRGDNPVFGGKLFFSTTWDSAMQVGRRRVVLDVPAARKIETRVVGSTDGPPLAARSERRDGRLRTVWDGTQLPAIVADDHLPHDVYAQRWLQFSEFSSWDAVNRWAAGLFPKADGGPAFDALLRQVRAAGTLEQQAVKALEFVQAEVRYLSLSLGENSHRPASPETVLARRYGDCKDKSQLLVALLNRLGIDAHVALLSTELPTGLDGLLPSPHLFNHAIVHLRLNGREYLLDPTRQGQHGSLARMGQPYAGHQVLLARLGARGLSVVAPAPDAVPLHRRIERFELDRLGAAAELTVTREAGGTTAEVLRGWLAGASREQLAKNFTSEMVERFPEAVALGELAVEDDRAGNRLRLTSRYRIPKLFWQDGAWWRMRWSAGNLRDTFHKVDRPTRRLALQASMLQPGELLEYEFSVKFRQPTGMLAASDKVAFGDPAFAFDVDTRQDPHTINMHLRLRGADQRVEPARLAAYANNLSQLERHLFGSYAVAETPPSGSAPVEPSADAIRAKLQERLAQLTGAVANAQFRAVDPSTVLCERARVHLALGGIEDAFKDAQQAVRLQSAAPAALRCRAAVHFAARRFIDAEADYARAVALGANDAELYASRALNAVYLADTQLAVSQLRQAMARTEDDAEQLRAQIWLALLNQGAAVATAAGPDERWLALLLEVVLGRGARPEQAIAQATGSGGAAANGRLGLAYYYLGKLAQSKGERFKALAYFQQALAKLGADDPYHHAASHELARLKEKKS